MTTSNLTPEQLRLAQAIYNTAKLLGEHLKGHEDDLDPRLLGAGIGTILINSLSIITGEDEFAKALKQVTDHVVDAAPSGTGEG